jgi:hypothetical protein
MPIFIELTPEGEGEQPKMYNVENFTEIAEDSGAFDDIDGTRVTFKDGYELVFIQSYVDVWSTLRDLNLVPPEGEESE